MNPIQCVTAWLDQFGKALEDGDVTAAADLFAEESYWRDLVSFTWNIKTMEGREQIADILRSQLDHVKPRGWKIDGEANEADGVIDKWRAF